MARNDITNDLIANTKGSAEKYAQGWDRLFGQKQVVPKLKGYAQSEMSSTPCFSCGKELEYKASDTNPLLSCPNCNTATHMRVLDEPMEIGHFMVDNSCVQSFSVEPLPTADVETLDDLVLDPESVRTFQGIAESEAFTSEAAHKAFPRLKRGEQTHIVKISGFRPDIEYFLTPEMHIGEDAVTYTMRHNYDHLTVEQGVVKALDFHDGAL